jgi:hypothetical protein
MLINKIWNKILKYSPFYTSKFSDCDKFWRLSTFNIDLVNLGSSSGKYAFDYSDIPLKASNWAMGPQALALDYAILQNYCSYLKDNATIILTLCPFTCMVGFNYISFTDKYYTILHHSSIPGFSIEKKIKICNLKNKPSLVMSNKEIVKSFITIPLSFVKQIIQFYRTMERNPHNDKELKKDALKWITGWKSQFSIVDLNSTLNDIQQNNFNSSALILHDIVTFCKERGYNPVIVIPPVTKYLNVYFNQIFKKIYIYDYIKKAQVENIPFLDYMDDERFSDPNLYFNSFFLNLRGRKIFTKQVLKDLNMLK